MNYFNINLTFITDPLSCFFMGVILLIAAPSAVYSIAYLRESYSSKKIVLNWFLLVLFVLSMISVVCAGNILYFLAAWEIMSLVSFFFVVFDGEKGEAVKAGTLYLVMTHIGTAFIAAAFLLMYKHAGSFDIYEIKKACLLLPAQERNIIFILLFIGFGTKAGIVPMHIWLPAAHPQAPSHISSIMSGVTIKTAVYGIIRFIIFTLGTGCLWWGILILLFAALSCLVGVIYALMEHDIKKLLAYSSVENIGIILLGIGASMVFIYKGWTFPAVLAMVAGLYHIVNHAVFKSLLFLCAGSVYKATGTRNIEKLGGLVKTMPWTAASFLMGSMAISAIPPLNGFVSEWLILQALFAGALNSATIEGKLFFGIAAAALALTGGLAAACFVKAFGITFLAVPRSSSAVSAKEVPGLMKFTTAGLALLTVVLGLAAVPVIKLLTKISGPVLGVDISSINLTLNNFVIAPGTGNGVYMSGAYFAAALAAVSALIIACLYLVFGRSKTSMGKTWGCGYYNLDSRTEYTATAFSKPFRIAFGFFLKPYQKTEKTRESLYHIKSFKYETHTTPVFNVYGYDILMKIVISAAKRLRKLQPGSIHLYLSYIFITVLALIVFMSRF